MKSVSGPERKRNAKHVRLLVTVSLVLMAALPAAQQVNPDAAALKQFNDRVKAYLVLRERVKAAMPPLKPTEDPAIITTREHGLGEAIRAARPHASAGDIFEPAKHVLRRIIRDDFRHRSEASRREVFAEMPPGLDLHVNQFYPTTVPLPTVPAELLAALPRLPDGLEYRIVGRDLILRDTNPNLIVDVLVNAVPEPAP